MTASRLELTILFISLLVIFFSSTSIADDEEKPKSAHNDTALSVLDDEGFESAERETETALKHLDPSKQTDGEASPQHVENLKFFNKRKEDIAKEKERRETIKKGLEDGASKTDIENAKEAAKKPIPMGTKEDDAQTAKAVSKQTETLKELEKKLKAALPKEDLGPTPRVVTSNDASQPENKTKNVGETITETQKKVLTQSKAVVWQDDNGQSFAAVTMSPETYHEAKKGKEESGWNYENGRWKRDDKNPNNQKWFFNDSSKQWVGLETSIQGTNESQKGVKDLSAFRTKDGGVVAAGFNFTYPEKQTYKATDNGGNPINVMSPSAFDGMDAPLKFFKPDKNSSSGYVEVSREEKGAQPFKFSNGEWSTPARIRDNGTWKERKYSFDRVQQPLQFQSGSFVPMVGGGELGNIRLGR